MTRSALQRMTPARVLVRSTLPGVAGAAVAGLTVALNLCSGLDRRVADALFATMPTSPGGGIVIVDVSQAAAQRGDALRLPRGDLAKLLSVLKDAGASKVLLDMTLTGPTASADDEALAAELARRSPTQVALTASAVVRTDADGSTRWSRSEIHPAFEREARIVASDLAYDGDGTLRRFGLSGHRLPAMQSSARWLAGGSLNVESGMPQPIDFAIDASAIPVVDAASLLDKHPETARPALKSLAGRAVVLASFASALGGDIPTPRFGALKRPVITAMAAETLLRPQPLRAVGKGALVAFAIVAAIVIGLWSRRRRPSTSIAVLAGLALCAFGLAARMQAHLGLLVPIATPVVAVAVGCLAVRGCSAFVKRRALRAEQGAMITFAQDGTVLSMTEAARSLFGPTIGTDAISIEDLFGAQAGDLLATTDASRPGRLTAVIDHQRSRRHLDLSVSTIRDNGKRWVGVASIRDITEQQQQIEELRRLVVEDALTGLCNRLGFEQALAEACASRGDQDAAQMESAGVAVLLCDLDGFKAVNDTHGHQAGDTLLRVIAGRMSDAASPDMLVARLGGDEFAILIRADGAADAPSRMVERLSEAVSRPIAIGMHAVSVGISIGVATWPGHGRTPDAIMHAADTEMYRNKRRRIAARRSDAA